MRIVRNYKRILLIAVIGGSFLRGQTETGTPPAPGGLIDVGGYRVHLYCTGNAGPAVMVVGGGFSFDWGLVQPAVAPLARICTYDPSGAAWSDPFPLKRTPTCSDRVTEIHELLRRASVPGPIVIVGFSIGGLYGRLYATTYPEEVAGIVIVDHAFVDSNPPPPSAPRRFTESAHEDGVFSANEIDTPPALISQESIALGIEDDRNFQRLPAIDRDLHAWAMSQHPIRPNAETVAECAAEIDKGTRPGGYPLGDKPLVVISTTYNSETYQHLQAELLHLSHNSTPMVAERSTHMVIVDEPETIVTAIEKVIGSIRDRRPVEVIPGIR